MELVIGRIDGLWYLSSFSQVKKALQMEDTDNVWRTEHGLSHSGSITVLAED